MTGRDVAWQASGRFLGNVLFPRVAHRVRWMSRQRGRRLAFWIGLDTAFRWAILEVIVVMRRAHEDWLATAETLRAELGREPTLEDIRDRVMPMTHGGECP